MNPSWTLAVLHVLHVYVVSCTFLYSDKDKDKDKPKADKSLNVFKLVSVSVLWEQPLHQLSVVASAVRLDLGSVKSYTQ